MHCYLDLNGKKKIDLVHGVVKKVKGREVVMVDDKEKFDELFHTHGSSVEDFYLVKRTPSLDLIKRHVKDTGEIPEGCNFGRNPDKIKIEIKEEQEVTEIVSDDVQVLKGESLQDIPFT